MLKHGTGSTGADHLVPAASTQTRLSRSMKLKFGVKVIVTLRLISSVELKFQMWGSVLTVCEEDIWQFNNSTNTTTTTLLGSDANQTILG